MLYKKPTIDNALTTLVELQVKLKKINHDEPLIEDATKKISSAVADLMKVQEKLES